MILDSKAILYRIYLKISILIFVLGFVPSNLLSQDLLLRFSHLTVKEGLAQNRIVGIAKDKYGFMWFGTWNGLSKYDGYKFTNYTADKNNPKAIKNNRINQLYKDDKEVLWILGSDSLIYRYNYESDDFTTFTKYSVPKTINDSLDKTKTIFFTKIIRDGYIWQVNQIGNILSRTIPLNKINYLLTQFNCKTQEEYTYRQNQLNYWALNDEFVYWIYCDDNEMFWVGTYGGGVNKADLRQKQIQLYQHSIFDKNTIIDNFLRGLYEDQQGNLWVGTNNKGFTKFNRKQNKCTHYQFNPRDTLNSLINNQVKAILCDKYGYVWIGTKEGIDRFNPANNHFYHYNLKPNHKKPDNQVFGILEDHSDNLWFATFNGIAKYDRKNDKFTVYPTNFFPNQQRTRVIVEDRNHYLWIATDGGGLLCMRHDTIAGCNEKLSFLAEYRNQPQNANSLIDNRIYAILEDEKGFLWLGTAGGLDRLDPKNKTFSHFNKKNGLPDELIMGVLGDKKGHIWISHKRGLSKLDIKSFKIRNYTQQDGLQDDEFSENAFFRNDRTGEMFFGGVNGLNAFFPDSIKDNPHLPKVVLTNLEVSNSSVVVNKTYNGRIILHKALHLTHSITLTYLDKTISIEFAALHYSNPTSNKYAYKLEGFNNEWIYTDASRRIAAYSNLEPGTYTFKVKASNNDGLWNPIPTELKIIVVPPWWKTLGFKLIVVISFILLIFIIYYLRIESYRNKQNELTILVKQRTQEISNANDNLRERQTRIEEYTEELKTHTENLQEANNLLISKQILIETQTKQLSILNSTKDRFFAILAHDLRNPFHTVSGFAEILINDYRKMPFEKIERFLNLIYSSSNSGKNLLENLLQWSRSQTGRISHEPVTLNLSAMADETITLLEGHAIHKNIIIHSSINQDIMVFADENMVKTIFRNIISNAIKFTPENGTITITATMDDLQVEITVSDTGVGISYENIPKLFRIDTSVSTKGTSNETGTGLGLILCKEFVEKHSGKIWVESEIDKGSKFKFTLPIA